jgi:hypothetical protein
MNAKKPAKPTKKDIQQQKVIEKRVKAEKIDLDNIKGKERFERVLKNLRKQT